LTITIVTAETSILKGRTSLFHPSTCFVHENFLKKLESISDFEDNQNLKFLLLTSLVTFSMVARGIVPKGTSCFAPSPCKVQHIT
jgi:hypothetical protein